MSNSDYPVLNELYLIKCFSCEEYRTQFNTGEKIYLNSTHYFHNLENTFQADSEGLIFAQGEGTSGQIILSKEKQSIESIIKKYRSNQYDSSDLVIPTQNAKMYINGFIACFAMIPKGCIRFNDRQISCDSDNTLKWLYGFLNSYARENSGYCYVSIYDAAPTIQSLDEGFCKKGYKVAYSQIKYENLSETERIQAAINLQIDRLVFTKRMEFSYQREFRIFISKCESEPQDHIEEGNISIQSHVVSEFAYLSPEKAQELGISEHWTQSAQ